MCFTMEAISVELTKLDKTKNLDKIVDGVQGLIDQLKTARSQVEQGTSIPRFARKCATKLNSH